MACLLLRWNSRKKQLKEEGFVCTWSRGTVHHVGEDWVAGCSGVEGVSWKQMYRAGTFQTSSRGWEAKHG